MQQVTRPSKRRGRNATRLLASSPRQVPYKVAVASNRDEHCARYATLALGPQGTHGDKMLMGCRSACGDPVQKSLWTVEYVQPRKCRYAICVTADFSPLIYSELILLTNRNESH